MQNIKYKSLVSFFLRASVVFLLGLTLLISSQGAYADNPTQSPPDGPVTPTFSGLVVEGISEFFGSVTLGDPTIGGPDIIDIKAYLLNSLVISGQDIPLLIADHILVGGHGNFIGNLNVQGDTTAEADFLVEGNTTLGDAAADTILVTGDMEVSRMADMRGGVKNDTVIGAWHVPFIVYDNVFLQQDLLVTQNISTFSDIFAFGDIESDSAITADEIGSFYIMQAGMGSGSSGMFNYSQACKPGDIITGCTGYLSDTDNNDEYFGAMILDDQRTCRAWAELKGPNLGSITVTANCFDPQGLRSGKNP